MLEKNNNIYTLELNDCINIFRTLYTRFSFRHNAYYVKVKLLQESGYHALIWMYTTISTDQANMRKSRN